MLYGIGTDQIKGFAVTLILGILMSMYTAIFCSRVIFDIAERKGWLSKLGMSSIVGETHIDFHRRDVTRRLSCRSFASYWASLPSTCVAPNLFDIDFRGGTSVQVALTEPAPIEDIRQKSGRLADDVWVTAIQPADREKDTVFKIDTSIEDVELLKTEIVAALTSESGESLLESHSMEFHAAGRLGPDEPTGHARRRPPAAGAAAGRPTGDGHGHRTGRGGGRNAR